MIEGSKSRVIFKQEIIVRSEDIDAMGHVNNVVYLRWVQELAEAHWNNSTPQELRAKYVWVVLRHEIDYASPAFLDDKLMGSTWVESTDGAKSIRHVEIFNQTTNKLSAHSKTTWCLLSASTMRPKRIETDITDIFC